MADAYEREQMPGVGEVLFRHKVSSPRWMQAMLMALVPGMPLLVGVASAVGLAFAGQTLAALAAFAGGAALCGALAFVFLTFSTARIVVSEGEVHVQLGFAGPKIPIESVTTVELAPSGIRKVGMGVGRDLSGTTYYRMWGDNQRAVHLRTKDHKRWVFVMKEPEALHAAIVEAMARRDRGQLRVRVEVKDDGMTAEGAEQIEQSESEREARGRRRG